MFGLNLKKLWFSVALGMLGGLLSAGVAQAGPAAPEIDITPASLSLDFGDVAVGDPLTLDVIIANTGSADLTVSSVSLCCGSSNRYSLGGFSGGVIGAGTDATVNLTFAPTGSGVRTATLQIDSDDSDEATVFVAVTGNQVQPEIDVTPPTVDFGSVVESTTSGVQTVTILNSSSDPLTVDSVSLSGSGTFAIESGSFTGGVIGAGNSETVDLTFSPTAVQAESGSLDIVSNDADEPSVSVTLDGTGVAAGAPEIDVTPTSLSFGDVATGGGSAALSVTIENLGSTDLNISSLTTTNGVFAVTSGSTGAISSGANMIVEVTFTPTTEQVETGDLVILSDDSDEPSTSIPLDGTGVLSGGQEIEITPFPTMTFTDVVVGDTGMMSVTIANVGTTDLEITGVAFSGSSRFNPAPSFSSTPFTLAAGTSEVGTVSFSPTDTTQKTATLIVTSDDADEPSLQLDIDGTGIDPEIDVTPLTVDFGGVVESTTSGVQTVTILNSSSDPLTVDSVSLSGSGTFAIESGSFTGGVIGAGNSETVDLTFSPTAVQAESGSLDIVSNDADEPSVSVTLDGVGVAAGAPEIDVTPTSLSYGDVATGGGSSALTVTIENLGTTDLNISSLSTTNAVFAVTSGSTGAISSGNTLDVEVTFTPTTEQAETGDLVILSDDADEASTSIPLDGTGVLAGGQEIEITPFPTMTFADVVVGDTGMMSVTIANVGTTDLEITGVAFSGSSRFNPAPSFSSTPFTLAAGTSEVGTVSFSPTDTTQKTATLIVTSDDADEPSLQLDIDGTGIDPEIDVTPTTVDFGGVVESTTSAVQTVTILNSGSDPLTVDSVSLSGSGTFAIETGSFTGGVIGAGNSETVDLTFSPTAVQAETGSLDIVSNDADESTVSVTLDGTGIAAGGPEIDVTPTSLSYGNVATGGGSSALSVTIENLGSADLNISSLTTTNAVFAVTSGSTGAISSGNTLDVEVTFTPTTEQAETGDLVILSDDADEASTSIPLDGTGIAAGDQTIRIDPPTNLMLDFGNVLNNTPSDLTITIHNDGTAALTVSSVALCCGSSNRYSLGGFPSGSIAGGASEDVTLTFTPTGDGVRTATVEILSDDALNPSVQVAATGNGVSILGPEITVTPLSLDFGGVQLNQSSSLPVLIENVGSGALTVSTIALSGATSSAYSHDGGSNITLLPGTSSTVNVTLLPTTVGTHDGALEIMSDDTDEATVSVSLTGEGFTPGVPVLEVLPTSHDFGSVQLNTPTPQQFTVTNIGTGVLDVTGISFAAGSSSRYALSGTLSGTLLESESLVFEVTFTPTSEGIRTATVDLASNDATNPLVSVSITGNGATSTAPDIAVAPPSIDFGDVSLNTPTPVGISIQNTGGVTLNVSSIALTGASSSSYSEDAPPSVQSIVPGATFNFSVTLTPDAVGPHTGAIEISSDDPDEATVTVNLTGNGVQTGDPEIGVAPLSIDFGTVAPAATDSVEVTVSNTGTTSLVIGRIGFASNTSSRFSTNAPTTANVPAGGDLKFDVTFSPNNGNPKLGGVEIESNDADEPLVTVSLVGNAGPVGDPEIAVTPLSIDFGNVAVGDTPTGSFLIENNGTVTLAVSSIAFGANSSSRFQLIGQPSSVALEPTESVLMDVTFAPTSEGERTGTVEVSSNDADEGTVVVNLLGLGVLPGDPELTLIPTSLAFGSSNIGVAVPLEVTLVNSGTADLVISGIVTDSGTDPAFTKTAGPSSTTLMPGLSTVVQVTFTPTSAGPVGGDLEIQSNDPTTPVARVPLSGTGVDPLVPEIEVTPLALSFGEMPLGGVSSLTATVKNIGTGFLNVSSITMGSNPSESFGVSALQNVTLGSLASLTIVVLYEPTVGGSHNGTVQIASNDPDEAIVEVFLDGSTSTADGDGISDPVDTLPAIFSNDFDDSPQGGSTSGTVIDRGDQVLTITDAASSPDGVTISAVGSGVQNETQAFVSACSGSAILSFEDGESAIVTCGSATVTSLAGTIDVAFIAENCATVNARLGPGNQLTFEPATLTFDAPSSNSGPAIVTAGSRIFSVAAGQSVTLPSLAELSLTPELLEFGVVAVADSRTLLIDVENVGTGDLVVRASIGNASGSGIFTAVGAEVATTVVPCQTLPIEVTYLAQSTGEANARLVLETNDPNQTIAAVPLSAFGGGALFKRADVNADGEVDLSDSIFNLGWQFLGNEGPTCEQTADTNGDLEIDLSDAVFALNYLFTGGLPPPAPLDSCGSDAAAFAAGISCESYAPCDL